MPSEPKPGRGVVWGVGAGTLALVAGVVAASQTVGAIDPLYRFGPEPRTPRVVEAPSTPAEPASFTPIRWSGFAALPPPARDGYDDPALLAEPRARPAPRPPSDLPPPEPVRAQAAVTPDTPAAETLDLPPPVIAAELGGEG